MAKNKRDIRQEITDTLIAKLEEGPEAWKKCWATVSGEMPLRVTGDRYKGINLLRLMIAAATRIACSPVRWRAWWLPTG